MANVNEVRNDKQDEVEQWICFLSLFLLVLPV